MKSLQSQLMRGMLPVMLLLGAAIVAITFIGARTAVMSLSQQIIAGTMARTQASLQRFFDPAIAGLRFARALGEAGLLPTEGPDAINAALTPMLDQFPQISSLMVADGRGREHMLLRRGENWTNRQTRVDQWGARSLWIEWSGDDPPRQEWRTLGYDPRTRPWYQGAQGAGGAVHWTPPYAFFTTGDPGITASTTFDAGAGVTGTLGFDVMLRDLSRFTRELSRDSGARVFVTSEDGRLLGLPALDRFQDADARAAALLRTAAEIGDPLLMDTVAAVPGDGSGPVRFRSEGGSWIADSEPFQLGANTTLRVTVLVPESDLLGDVVALRWWIVALTLIAMALASWRTAVEARRVSQPIRAMVRQTERISRGNLSRTEPVHTSIEEVHRLAESQDHMRVSLEALLKLERDIQLARQIQQDTFPRSVPVLEGFAVDAWSEPAEETGGDTYDLVTFRRTDTGEVVVTEHGADRMFLLLADAVGHGIGPALLVTQVRAMLRMAVRTGAPIDEIVRHLNEQLSEDLTDGRFITMWLGELDTASGRLEAFSAGQGPLLHYAAKEREVRLLDSDAPPLGVLPDLEVTLPAAVLLAPGDLFAVVSDGFFDARSPEDEMFGTARVSRILEAGCDETPTRILERLRAEVDAFTAGAAADDDRTAIVLKRI